MADNNDIQRASDAHAAWQCQETVTRFSCHFDAGEHSEMERYFTQDGVWRRNEGEIVGLPALKAFLAGRTRSALTRHVLSNVRVTLQGSEHAIVHSYVTAYRHQFAEAETLPAPLDQALLVGRYQDTLVLVKREWKIALRELQVDFRRR